MPRGFQRDKLARRVADLFELPRDIVLDLPKITVIGNVQVQIENHQGIIEYLPELVRINTTRGEIVISGRELAIGNIGKDEIVVDGRVFELRFHDWGGE